MSDYTEFKLVPVNKFKKLLQDHPQGGVKSISDIKSKYNTETSSVTPHTQIPTQLGQGTDPHDLYWSLNDPKTLPKYIVISDNIKLHYYT